MMMSMVCCGGDGLGLAALVCFKQPGKKSGKMIFKSSLTNSMGWAGTLL
jgi:hypothetical protein